MPAGCEFICENNACEYCKTGFSITAPWPMANISIVINSLKNKEHQKLKQELIKLKSSGKKLALITLPNIYNVTPEFYRVQMWSDKEKCVWDFPVKYSKDASEQDLYSSVPTICEKTGDKLLSFTEVVEQGINCPKCGEKLAQSRWYTNEI